MDRQHLQMMEIQPSQKHQFDYNVMFRLHSRSQGFALVDDDGAPFALFFFAPQDNSGRVAAYTVFAPNLGRRRLLFAARQARDWLQNWGEFRRCEAFCDGDAVDEIHWCRYVLRMKLEGILRAFTSEGKNVYAFAWVRGWDGN